MSKERIRRPQPTRTQPVRNLSTLFGGAGARRPGDGDGADESARDRKGVASLGEAVSRSVELGYRVVDDYIQQGQRAAQRLNDRSLAPETITRDVQELSARMAQYASDFFGVWFEMLELATAGSAARRADMTPSGNAASAAAPAPPPTPPRAPREPSSERTRVRIEVISAKPAEVSLDLMPDAGRSSLVVHALRAVDPEKPRLADVVLERGAGGEPLTLRIRVPADQPPGVYNGLIIDEQTNRPAGTVSVRLGAG